MTIYLPYSTLRTNFDSSNDFRWDYLGQKDLFEEIGWEAFVGNPFYENTCAIRMSLALLKSGYEVTSGSHRILAGPYKGKRIEVNMAKLAKVLSEDHWFGKPETVTAPDVSAAIVARCGIIAFHRIPGFPGNGHIDLIDNSQASLRCASFCFFGAKEIWFWPLPLAGA